MVVLFLVISIPLASVPYLYNYWHYKNPFFPVLSGFFSRFGGLKFDWFILQHKTNFGLLGFVLLPWDMSVNVEFAHMASRLVGPVILATAPAGVAMLWRFKRSRILLTYFLFEFVHWFFLKTHVRHIFPHIFMMAVFSAAVFTRKYQWSQMFYRSANAGLAVFLFYTLCNVSFIYAAPIRGGLGILTREEQIAAMPNPQIPSRPIRDFFNDPSREGDVVCHICESSYFIAHRKLAPSYFTGERSLFTYQSMEELMEHLRKNNVKYILYNDSTRSILLPSIGQTLLDSPLFSTFLIKVAAGEHDRLYQIDWLKWDQRDIRSMTPI